MWGAPLLTNLDAKRASLWVCVLYTLLTVTSSTWQLLQGVEHDSNLHLLARFAVTVVGVGSLALFAVLHRRFRRAPAVKAAGSSYLISVAAVLALVWGFGHLEPLHPDAYRDIVLNFTAIWLVISLVLTLAPPATRRLRAHGHPVTSSARGGLVLGEPDQGRGRATGQHQDRDTDDDRR